MKAESFHWSFRTLLLGEVLEGLLTPVFKTAISGLAGRDEDYLSKCFHASYWNNL